MKLLGLCSLPRKAYFLKKNRVLIIAAMASGTTYDHGVTHFPYFPRLVAVGPGHFLIIQGWCEGKVQSFYISLGHWTSKLISSPNPGIWNPVLYSISI